MILDRFSLYGLLKIYQNQRWKPLKLLKWLILDCRFHGKRLFLNFHSCILNYLIGDWTSIWQKFQHCHSNAYAGWNPNEVSSQLIIIKLRDAFDDVQKGELHDRHGAEDESAVDKRIELEHDANSANPNWHWTKPETQKIGARDQNDMAYHLRILIMWATSSQRGKPRKF